MAHPARQQPTILVIDDNITNLKVAMEHLQSYSFRILTARDGESGLERVRLAHPDLILLDVQLPGIDGIETCRRLKANPASAAIPVILMTVLSETADKVRGLEAGAVDYVTKPFEAAELLVRIQTHLTLRSLQSELEALVAQRTAALAEEIERRKRSQAEKELLLDLVRQQSEQLREQLQRSAASAQQREAGLRQSLHDEVEEQIRLAADCLSAACQALTDHSPARPPIARAQALLAAILEQTRHISSNLEAPERQDSRNNPLLKLTTREYEVLQLLIEGRSNAEIAEILGVTRATVSTYRQRIMHKLEIRDLPSLIKLVLRHQPGA